MYSLKIKCPYCLHQVHISLSEVSQYRHWVPTQRSTINSQLPYVQRSSETDLANAFTTAFCPACNNPLMITFQYRLNDLLDAADGVDDESQLRAVLYNGTIRIYPEPRLPDDSPHYPEKIRAVFTELQEDVQSGRTAPRIIAGCRSVLEVALRALGYEKGNLLSRIELARQDGILTESMRNWAHRIRMEGNEAVHELEASDEQAKEFVAFLRLFLEVAFVLPERIKEQQK